MGNCSVSLVKGRYEIIKDREGYAVILGNEMSAVDTEETVGQRLLSVEKALNSCRFHAMAVPFLSRTDKDKVNATFSKEDFKRVCLMHFDRDMLNNLSGYSSHLFYYCGQCNEQGIITKDGDNLTYSEVTNSILQHSQNSGKPIVLVFDCNFGRPVTDIDNLVSTIKSNISLHENVLICFVFQYNTVSTPPGIFTKELGPAIQMFSNHLPLTDIITIAALKAKLMLHSNEEECFVHRPVLLSTLSAQLFLVTEPTPPIMDDILSYADYCYPILKEQGTTPLPVCEATPTPGNGRRVFIACTSRERCQVWKLSLWLQSLGFQVYCDDTVSEENSKEWLRWYSAHLIKCEFVLVECSPEMMEGLNQSTANPESKGRSVCAGLISSLHQKLDKDEVHLRFFPVIFSAQFGMEFVPAVFAGDKIYKLFNKPPERFDPQRMTSDYDELIFDICDLRKPVHLTQPVVARPIITNEKPSSMVITPEMIESFYKLRPGYIPVSYPPVSNPSPFMYQRPLHAPPPFIRPVPPIVNPAPPHRFTNPPSGFANAPQGHPPRERRYQLPEEPVTQSALLWLSQRVTEWKFMGRKLEVPEYELIKISRENPHNISEQVIQMLYIWKNQTVPCDVTYQKLVDALKFAEMNEKLCDEFVQFVCEQ